MARKLKVATLVVEINAETVNLTKGLNQATNEANKFGHTISTAVGTAIGNMVTAGIAQIGRLTSSFINLGKESVMTAARAQELGLVAHLLGERMGYSAQQVDGFVSEIKEAGIRTDVAQQLVAQFARRNLDMAQSVDLARVAQDAAVLSMTDSSEALDNIIYGITTYNKRVLRTAGLNVDIQGQFEALADTLGITTQELTEEQKVQAALNGVLEEGARIAGVYETAMETPGKRIRSLSRHLYEFKRTLGEAFIDALGEGVGGAETFVKWLSKIASEGGDLRIAMEKLGQNLAHVIGLLADNLPRALEAIEAIFKGDLDEALLNIGAIIGDIFGRDAALQFREWGQAAIAMWEETWPKIQEVIQTAWSIIKDIFTKIRDWLTSEGPSKLESFRAVFDEVWSFIKEQAAKVVAWFQENLPLIQETGQTLADFWQNHIAPALDNVWNIIKEIVSTAIDTVLGIIRSVMLVITGDWEGAWENIKQVASDLWESIKTIWNEFLTGVLEAAGTNLEEFKETWRNNWEMVKTIVETIWDRTKEGVVAWLQTIVDIIISWKDRFVQAGSDIIQGMKEGILHKFGEILTAVKEKLREMINKIREAAGIHSPSLVFMEMGREMMEGLALGMASAAGLPVMAMLGAAGAAGDTYNYTFSQTVNTRATTPTVVQDFMTMRALVGA